MQDGKWDAFCRNVSSLPWMRRAPSSGRQSGGGGGGFGRGGSFVNSLGAMADETSQAVK